MKRTFFCIAAALMLVGLQAIDAQQTGAQGEKLLAAAQHKATVDGDLRGAIDAYKKIVSGAGSNRALAAQALVRMAECYQKLGDAEANKIYQRVVRDYADQADAVKIARTRMGSDAALQNAGTLTRQVWVSRPWEDPSYGSVSADGRYITFTDWETGDLCIRDLKAGTNRRLTHNDSGDYAQNSIFSPDGRQIAYSWFMRRDSRNQVRVIPTDGGNPQTLWRSEGFTDYVLPKDWGRDGRLVAVHILPDRTSQLALLALQDGSIRALKSFSWQNFSASLSPDGRWIAYDSPSQRKSPDERRLRLGDGWKPRNRDRTESGKRLPADLVAGWLAHSVSQ